MKAKFTLELKNLGNFLTKLAEQSECVYWLSSPDFKNIIYISPAYEKIWGRSREILYKNPSVWIDYLVPEDVKYYHPIHAMAERIAQEGDSARYNESYRIQRPDGEIRWILDRGFPIYNKENICVGATGVAVDVTQIKLYEQALIEAKEVAERALKSKEIAEQENRNKSRVLHDVLKELKKERYYLAGEHHGTYLTKREAQCLLCLAGGNSAKETGKMLDISPRTVEYFLNRLKIRFNCASRSQLISKAIECRFLDGIKPMLP
jgi:PAS domain S-box-containing protein